MTRTVKKIFQVINTLATPPTNPQPPYQGHYQTSYSNSSAVNNYSTTTYQPNNHQPQISQQQNQSTPLVHWRTAFRPEDDDDPYHPDPIVRDDGPPNEIVYACQSSATNYELHYYRHPSADNFLICSFCHAKYLANTPISPCFQRTPQTVKGICKFRVPRLIDSLLPTARRTQNYQPILDFIIHRASIPDCKKEKGLSAKEAGRWYVPNQPKDFAACKACFEDVVLAMPFGAQNFHRKRQPADMIWMCDVWIPFVKRSFARFSKKPQPEGFHLWIQAVGSRTALPKCPGPAPVTDYTGRWYVTRRAPGLSLCEACYYDQAALTLFCNEFDRDVNHIAGNARRCHFAAGGHPIRTVFQIARQRKSVDVLVRGASTIINSPPCSSSSSSSSGAGKMYTLAQNPTGMPFQICPSCFAGYFETMGLSSRFKVVPAGAPGTSAGCSLNPSSRAFLLHLNNFIHAYQVGVWSIFTLSLPSTHLRSIPPCPGATPIKNARWYGYPDLTVCPHCHETFSKSTSLSALTPLQNTLVASAAMCALYSPRMRQKWLKACRRSDSSPDEMLEFSRQRTKVWIRYNRETTMLKVQQDQAFLNAQQALLNSATAGAASMISSAAGGSRYWHGNSRIGWYDNRHGADAAVWRNQGNAFLAESNDARVQMRLAELKNMWKAVE